MESSRGTRVPWWATVADVLTVALAALALVVGWTGGVRRLVAGVLISVTSESRLLVFAAVITGFRHLLVRRPALPVRLLDASRAVTRCAAALAVRAPGSPPGAPGDEFRTAGRSRAARVGEIAAVVAMMTVISALMTSSQVRTLDGITDPGDPVFSIWRLSWVAHQLARDPLHLFDANVMYPARHTLAYSDSLLLPNIVAAPFVWLGARPVIVHSLFLIGSFVLAGVCMYLFVRAVTGNMTAAMVAAIAFAFYPYRFDQYCHFEQLISFWMPLALWGLHRTMQYGRTRDGLLTGAAIAGQYLSGMYLGAYLVVWLVPVWFVLALGRRAVRASLRPLAAGALLAAVLIAPTLPPHLAARQIVGERSTSDVEAFSAQPHHYLVANPARIAYSDTLGRGRHDPERDLFPGLLIVLLAGVAMLPPWSASRLAYMCALAVAFDASLGANGHVFPVLYKLFVPFRAFRVPARFSMLVGLSLALLAGYGAARLASWFRRPALRVGIAALVCAALLWEGRFSLVLEPIWQTVPKVYAWFDGRPDAVVTVLPPPPTDALQNFECAYMYYSTFHWHRLTNGYSGAWPQDYFTFLGAMRSFPADSSVQQLRQRGVEYVVVHEGFYGHQPYRQVIAGIDRRTDFKLVARSAEGRSESRIYQVLR
jgi:hypothetical protein